MTKYEEEITSTLKEIGFKVTSAHGVDCMYKVLNKEDKFIGYLMTNVSFCTIGNGDYQIVFDSAEKYPNGAILTKDGAHSGSINL